MYSLKKLPMPNKVTYEYAIIRVVPRVEREEFLNVGVIVFSKRKKYLDMKFHLDKDRLLSFSPSLDVDLVADYLQAWEWVCQGHPAGGTIGEAEMPYRFRWLTAARSTILQSSRPHAGLCEEPAEVLEDLLGRYVR